MKNLGKESPWGGVSNSRVKANLGPAWESWLGHSSPGFRCTKRWKWRQCFVPTASQEGSSSRGTVLAVVPGNPAKANTQVAAGNKGRCRVPLQKIHGPSTFNVNTPHPTELLHFISVALTLSVVTNNTVRISSVQICTNLLYVSKGFCPSWQSSLNCFLPENK